MKKLTLKQRLGHVQPNLIAAFSASSVVSGALKKAAELAAEKDRNELEQRNYESRNKNNG